MQCVVGAALLVAVLAIGAPVWAESPMTPLRRTAPPSEPPSTAQQWIEPPAVSARKSPSHATAEDAEPIAQPEQPARQTQTSRQGRRGARGRGWSNDYLARQLNRQQLYGAWSGVSVPYYRGYGPAPYSASGN